MSMRYGNSENSVKLLIKATILAGCIVVIGKLLGASWKASLAMAIFIFTVFLLITEAFSRAASAFIGSALMLILIYFSGVYDLAEFASHTVHLDVILALLGVMLVAAAGLKSGFLYYVGIKIAKISRGDPIRLYAILAIFAYALSFALNCEAGIAVVVSLTLAICGVLRMDPRPYVLMEIFIINVSASTTLIAGIPNIIVAEEIGLPYEFFIVNLTPLTVILFLISLLMLYTYIPPQREIHPLVAAAILDMDEWLFVRNRFEFYASLVSIVGLVIGFIALRELMFVSILFSAIILVASPKTEELLHEVDWDTILFFLGFYIIVGGLEHTGVLDLIAHSLLSFAGNDVFILLSAIFWLSLLVSGFLDNVPYIITVLPIVQILVSQPPFSKYESLFWIALIFACNIGGGLNPYSSPYNLLGLSMAKKANAEITSDMFYGVSRKWTICSGTLAYIYLLLRLFAGEIIEILSLIGFVATLTIIIVVALLIGIRKAMGLRRFFLESKAFGALIKGIVKKKLKRR